MFEKCKELFILGLYVRSLEATSRLSSNMIDKNRCSRSKPSFYQQVYPISDVSEKLISVSHKPFEFLVGPGEVNYF